MKMTALKILLIMIRKGLQLWTKFMKTCACVVLGSLICVFFVYTELEMSMEASSRDDNISCRELHDSVSLYRVKS